MRTLFSRLLTLLIAACIAGAPLPATAAPAPTSEPEADAAMARARELYEQGKDHFETAEYERALVTWREAYRLLPDTEQAHVIRHALVYNISAAEIKAYEVSRNPTHLRKAKALLESYLSEHRELYGDTPAANQERASVRDRLAETEAMIEASQERGETALPLGEPTPPTSSEATPVTPEGPSPQLYTPEQQSALDKARRQTIGGAIMVSIGGLFFLLATGSIAGHQRTEQPATTLTTGLVTATLSLGLVAGGAALIGIAKKTKREIQSPVALSPYWHRDGGGAQLRWNF